MAFKAYVKNYYDIQAMQPAGHVMAHSAPFANAASMGYDPAGPDWTYQYFSSCEITFGGAALPANHPKADHVFYITEGYGYAMIGGKRFTYQSGDIMWAPGSVDHEMYPFGTATLKFLVTLCPQGFKPSEPYIKNVNDVSGTAEPGNEGVTFFTLASPAITGSGSQEFHIVEILPGAKLSLDTPKSDVIAHLFTGVAEAAADGEKLPMKKAEDVFVCPKGAKWEIANAGKQVVRLALSISTAR
ncbi:MAG: cupin domain-containing protein [Clostridiales Family XIII bacterium]|jgi:mannose-6-phosphate isomerase-like protein (cupin superfamily)|nr:cupin domain-containing protein [Clostridiales Family XIII bacterium]